MSNRISSNREYYLDGDVIVEIDADGLQYRFWPDSGSISPSEKWFRMDELEPEFWRDGDSVTFDGIRENGMKLAIVKRGGERFLAVENELE